tara:strand:+ start:2495 stop:2860 length:366 start_codon:yes stop_codon:yes gene_type:complete
MEYIVKVDPQNEMKKLSKRKIDKSFEREIYLIKKLAKLLYESSSKNTYEKETVKKAKELGFIYRDNHYEEKMDTSEVVISVSVFNERNIELLKLNFSCFKYLEVKDSRKSVIKFTTYYTNF